MSELGDLYQEVILDHSKSPKNFGELPEFNRKAEGFNPLCGDRVTVFLRLEGDRIQDIRFQGSGCAISTASASMMTESLKGKTLEEAQKIFHGFQLLTTGQEPGMELGKLAVFSGVGEFPARVKCATLAWHALHSAVESGASGVQS